ncbi:MAG: cation-translocating P-type ATPase [Clostridia bacterium]|nr:cation-translocating P-type ATPase [Clostridia bacterium]
MKKIILSIDGMTCSACSNGLEKYLNKQNGIINASVNLVLANAFIEYDEKILNQEKLERFVQEAGFKSLGEFKEIKSNSNNKKQKILFIAFTFLAIIVMYISMGHMLNLPTLKIINPYSNPINYCIVLLIFTIAFIAYGFDIIKNGYKNLIHKSPNMDTLVAIGVISSFLYSLYSMYMIIKGTHHEIHNLYFESAAIVIYFIKLGRYIDKISKDKTKEAIQKLVEITPKNAVVKVNGIEKTVTLDEIHKGDIIVCKPGEKIAVDGQIVLGKTHIDESLITGESKPALKTVGQKVIAGSVNYDGYIEYTAEKIGKESRISEIVRLVVEASNTKAPIAKLADTVSGYFVPAVIIIAILTFIIYLILGFDFATSIITFVTVLVVACPCSLGLATPLAIVISEGLCAKNGILVKKSEILENAQKVNTIIFDKTGTLTYGKLKISDVINYTNLDNDKIIQLVASLENKSTHPIAKAFTDYLKENKLELLPVNNFENISGYGIIGNIDNNELLLGNSKLLDKYEIENIHLEDETDLTSKRKQYYICCKKQRNNCFNWCE